MGNPVTILTAFKIRAETKQIKSQIKKLTLPLNMLSFG
jgi:hypothetical protein